MHQLIQDLVDRGAAPGMIRIVSVVCAPPALKLLADKFVGLKIYTGELGRGGGEVGKWLARRLTPRHSADRRRWPMVSACTRDASTWSRPQHDALPCLVVCADAAAWCRLTHDAHLTQRHHRCRGERAGLHRPRPGGCWRQGVWHLRELLEFEKLPCRTSFLSGPAWLRSFSQQRLTRTVQ